MKDHFSTAGVRIAADLRDNLIIDRYDPVFSSMRMSKRKYLRSANSEDAVTWNVFRTLRQFAPTVWLPDLFSSASPGAQLAHTEHGEHGEHGAQGCAQGDAPPPRRHRAAASRGAAALFFTHENLRRFQHVTDWRRPHQGMLYRVAKEISAASTRTKRGAAGPL